MGKITDIVLQKKDQNRVNIFVEGQFAFGISAETRFIKKLEVGKNLSEFQINKLIEADQVDRLLAKSFKFLSYRPRSEKETRDYLLRKVKPKDFEKSDTEKDQYEKSVEKTIQKLEKIGQINDQEFAKWLVGQRKKFRPRGNRLIKTELLQKGIDKDLIDQILNKTDVTEDFDLALKSAQKKAPSYKKLEKREFRIKMGQYLVRRGFDWNIVKNVVDTLLRKELK